MAEERKSRKNLADEFTGRIISQLKEGTAPWQKSWKAGEFHRPFNQVSGREYRGANVAILAGRGLADPRWMTYKQAQNEGWQVKRGAKSEQVLYWQWREERPILDEEGRPVLDDEGMERKETVDLDRPRMYVYNVFPVSQVQDGNGRDIPPYEAKEPDWNPHERAEAILRTAGVTIIHDQRDRAFYRASEDAIHLPPKENFPDAGEYYATALHELGHSLGHESRLNWETSRAPFGSPDYAKEELYVEIASWMLCQELGLPHNAKNHAAYTAHWVKALENDHYEIMRACQTAEKIVGKIMDVERGQVFGQGMESSSLGAPKNDFQPSPEEVRSADEALAKDVAAFAEEVDKLQAAAEEAIKNGKTPTPPSRPLAMLRQTPLVLQMLGTDAVSGKSAGERELRVSPHTFNNIIDGHHGITVDMLKQIPEAMVDPIMIFDSASGKANGDVVFMLGLKDANEATVVTPVALEVSGQNYSTINVVKSAYAKENDGVPNNEWFKNQAVKGENTRYYNKEKLERWQRESGVQFPFGTLRNAHGNTIYTNADLVKLREANSERYKAVRGEKVYLDVPFREKEKAKSLGATWDNGKKSWCARPGVPLEPLMGWVPEETRAELAGAGKDTMNLQENSSENAVDNAVSNEKYQELATEKTYLHVPFKEKEEAKALGAKWDRNAGLWYVPEGADLAPLARFIPEKDLTPPKAISPEAEFADALEKAGLKLNGMPVIDGQIHWVPSVDGKPGNRDGAYCAYPDGRPAGWMMNYRTGGEKINWVSTGQTLTAAQKVELAQDGEKRRAEREAERQKGREAAIRAADEKYRESSPLLLHDKHPYLEMKGVDGHLDGLNLDKNGNLLIPGYDKDGKLKTIQTINGKGQKFFEPGCPKAGAMHMIDRRAFGTAQAAKESQEFYICEGFATGASVHAATVGQGATVVAFDANNLKAVAMAIREVNPTAQISICADNDHKNDRNVGLEKANEAALAVGGGVLVPEFTPEEKARGLTDFNDLHQARGLGAVRDFLAGQKKGRETAADLPKAVGMGR